MSPSSVNSLLSSLLARLSTQEVDPFSNLDFDINVGSTGDIGGSSVIGQEQPHKEFDTTYLPKLLRHYIYGFSHISLYVV